MDRRGFFLKQRGKKRILNDDDDEPVFSVAKKTPKTGGACVDVSVRELVNRLDWHHFLFVHLCS